MSNRPQISAQRISDLMMLNLNYDVVEDYKKKYKITEKYEGQLMKLVDINFPDKMEVEEEPPMFAIGYNLDNKVVEDDYVRRI